MVLHLHLRIELVLSSKVEVANLVVDTNDRSETETRLCALQVYTIAIFVQFVKTLQASLCSSQLRLSLCLQGSELLGSICSRLCSHLEFSLCGTNLTVDVVDVALQELAKVYSTC